MIVQQPAQRQYLAIVDRHGRLDLALVDDEVARIIRYRPSDTANLLPQEQLDRTARIDLRLHLQLDAYILPLHGAELIVEILAERLRSDEHTSELQSLIRSSYAVFCLKTKKNIDNIPKRNEDRV